MKGNSECGATNSGPLTKPSVGKPPRSGTTADEPVSKPVSWWTMV